MLTYLLTYLFQPVDQLSIPHQCAYLIYSLSPSVSLSTLRLPQYEMQSNISPGYLKQWPTNFKLLRATFVDIQETAFHRVAGWWLSLTKKCYKPSSTFSYNTRATSTFSYNIRATSTFLCNFLGTLTLLFNIRTSLSWNTLSMVFVSKPNN